VSRQARSQGHPGKLAPGDPGCWRAIGIAGDASCPELVKVRHCRNCPVYTAAGRALIERPPPPDYLDAWTAFLAEAKVRANPRTLALLVFRLGDEWLGLRAADVVEVAETRPVHRIPHRPGSALGGLVNIRGQLLLFVSLDSLLRTDGQGSPSPMPGASGRERFVVIQRGADSWVFRADEVDGIRRFAPGEVAPAPDTVPGGSVSLSRGLVALGERWIGCLDGDALFATLRKTVG
jgi:chemotaxis-related protein WspD